MKKEEKLPDIVFLVPFGRRIDIKDKEIYVDGISLKYKIRREDREEAYRYLVERLGVRDFGISRTAIYKRLRREGLTLYDARRIYLEKIAEDKKLLEILLSIRTRGRFRKLLSKRLKNTF